MKYKLGKDYAFTGDSLVAQRLKRLRGILETRVRSLGREDPLEKEMATHSSTLAWRIPWMEEPAGLQSTGSQRVRHNWATSLSLFMLSQSKANAAPKCSLCHMTSDPSWSRKNGSCDNRTGKGHPRPQLAKGRIWANEEVQREVGLQ